MLRHRARANSRTLIHCLTNKSCITRTKVCILHINITFKQLELLLMPKSKIVMSDRTLVTRRVKFKLRGRKSLDGAKSLSTTELLTIVNDKNAGRRRSAAEKILHQRGVRDFTIVEVAEVA